MRRVGLALMAWSMAAPAAAQPVASGSDATDAKVAERIQAANAVYGVPDPRARCRPKPGDEIVVCADRGEDQRVDRGAPDTNTLAGRRALDGNLPRAPDMDDLDCRTHPRGVCLQGGYAPAPVYYVDVTKLPQAPAGSDAEAIANGDQTAP